MQEFTGMRSSRAVEDLDMDAVAAAHGRDAAMFGQPCWLCSTSDRCTATR
jgi:hypothetical protein